MVFNGHKLLRKLQGFTREYQQTGLPVFNFGQPCQLIVKAVAFIGYYPVVALMENFPVA